MARSKISGEIANYIVKAILIPRTLYKLKSITINKKQCDKIGSE